MREGDGQRFEARIDRRFGVQPLAALRAFPAWLRATLQSWRGDEICAVLKFARAPRAYDGLAVVNALAWCLHRADVFTSAFVVAARPCGQAHVIAFLPGEDDTLVITSQMEEAFDRGRQEGDVLADIRALETSLGPIKEASGVPGSPLAR